MKIIDLHTHSNYSDGTCTPAELLRLAKSKQLRAIALTDHDTVDGISPMFHAMQESDSTLELIPGAELSVGYHGKELHMVALFIDYHNQEFRETISHFLYRRIHRNEEMIENFQKIGIPMTMEDLKNGNPDTVVTRAHFAKFLVRNGIVKDYEEAFTDHYLGKGSPLYVPREHMNWKDAITLIQKANGIAILAHPLKYHLEEPDLRIMLSKLKEAGLAGMEVYYSEHSKQDTNFLMHLAKEFALLPSGGSDFHGANKPHIALGTGMGNLAVPYTLLQALKDYHQKQV